jgi:hypothetical protein
LIVATATISWRRSNAYRKLLTYSDHHVVQGGSTEERKLLLSIVKVIRGVARMNAIHFTHNDVHQRSPDLESAFNDDFQSAANSVTAALVRWLVILWALTTLAVGTFVIGRAILEYAPNFLGNISQIFS